MRQKNNYKNKMFEEPFIISPNIAWKIIGGIKRYIREKSNGRDFADPEIHKQLQMYAQLLQENLND